MECSCGKKYSFGPLDYIPFGQFGRLRRICTNNEDYHSKAKKRGGIYCISTTDVENMHLVRLLLIGTHLITQILVKKKIILWIFIHVVYILRCPGGLKCNFKLSNNGGNLSNQLLKRGAFCIHELITLE